MAFIASLLSNSRTPLVFLAIAILPLINLKNKQSVRLLAIAAIGIIILMPVHGFYRKIDLVGYSPGENRNTRQQHRNASGSIRSRLYSHVEKSPMGIGAESDAVLPRPDTGRPASWYGKHLAVDYGRTRHIGDNHLLHFYLHPVPARLAVEGEMPVLSPAGLHCSLDRIVNTGHASLSFLSGIYSDL